MTHTCFVVRAHQPHPAAGSTARAKRRLAEKQEGLEVRLVAGSRAELQTIRQLLREAGFDPGRPFAKGNKFLLPIYGRDAFARFLERIKGDAPTAPR